jgi:DNA-binding beta-propeller fold protein YncE
MKRRPFFRAFSRWLGPLAIVLTPGLPRPETAQSVLQAPLHHYLYVAVPGVRNYLQYGGHGLLVFDMDHSFRFLKRIPTGGLDEKGQPSNVKGIAVSSLTHCVYISTIQSLLCLDLKSNKLLWEKKYAGGCDRMSISADGQTIYLPSFEGDNWKILDAVSGRVEDSLVTNSGSHNTLYGQDGRKVYLEGLRSNYLTVVDAASHRIMSEVGPFANHVRPFTVNADQSRCYVNVDSLLGFEIGDLRSGRRIAHIQVKGFRTGPVKRHGCPSHGIALSPDEKEVWISDAFNESVHIFSLGGPSPVLKATIRLSDQPGWITFSLDGRYGFPSTGDIIEVASEKIITRLQDETGAYVQSEKMLEVQFSGSDFLRAGDQFGFGREKAK